MNQNFVGNNICLPLVFNKCYVISKLTNQFNVLGNRSVMNSVKCGIGLVHRHNLNIFYISKIFSVINLNQLCHYCSWSSNTHLTHVDKTGKARMVDVGSKPSSVRTATAQAKVFLTPDIVRLIQDNGIKKGDVLSVARLAGIVAAKQTSNLIPLCHNIPISWVNVELDLNTDRNCVIICASVRCEGKSGVEMEALTAASVSALTIYDMCKAVSHDIVISEIMLLEKTGGMRGGFKRGKDFLQ